MDKIINDKPLVSVIMPTYKRADMLSRAIDSVLSQTYKRIQVIVVDDNNPDTEWRTTTSKIMSQYQEDERVKYICHEKNKNGAAARNTGIRAADGDIVTFLDDDDVYLPEKVEEEVNYLLSHPSFQAVYCGYHKDGRDIICQKTGDLSFELLCGTKILITNIIMMWKKCAIECGGWDETLKRHQEAGFLLRFFDCGYKIGAITRVLVKFDMSDRGNAPSDPKKNEEIVWQYIKNYEYIIEKISAENPKARKIIYSKRYISIILEYLKNRNYKEAKHNVLMALSNMPAVFIEECFVYLFNKITKRVF